MAHYEKFEGDFSAGGKRFAVLSSRFNSFVVDHLAEGAIDTLRRHGVARENIELFKVPGAWEIPLAAKRIAALGRFDAIVAVGAVIRGGTPHFDYVAGECSKGLAQVSMEADMVIANGVLTVNSIEQAIERSGTKAGNKGAEAALSAIEMVSLFDSM